MEVLSQEVLETNQAGKGAEMTAQEFLKLKPKTHLVVFGRNLNLLEQIRKTIPNCRFLMWLDNCYFADVAAEIKSFTYPIIFGVNGINILDEFPVKDVYYYDGENTVTRFVDIQMPHEDSMGTLKYMSPAEIALNFEYFNKEKV